MLISQSPEMSNLLSIADRVAASSIPLLVIGKNDAGKNLLANYIHRASPYAQGPFINVNRGAIAEATFESALFVHTKGGFTDAKLDRIRRVELADQGTFNELAATTLDQADIWFIQQALNRHHGNAGEAAKILGISRSTLYQRLGKRVPL